MGSTYRFRVVILDHTNCKLLYVYTVLYRSASLTSTISSTPRSLTRTTGFQMATAATQCTVGLVWYLIEQVGARLWIPGCIPAIVCSAAHSANDGCEYYQ